MRLYDSDMVLAALRRLGFAPRHEVTGARKPKGSHWVMTKQIRDEHDSVVQTLTAPVPLDKKPIKRGTMKSILELLQLTEEDFESAVR